jgi:hypothetical protein
MHRRQGYFRDEEREGLGRKGKVVAGGDRREGEVKSVSVE